MPGLSWSAEDKKRLEELVRAGLGPLSIHRLGCFSANGHGARSVDAIAQQIRRLHLAPPEHSERARQARLRGMAVDETAKERATEFLQQNGHDVPVEYIAEKFGVTVSWVRRTLKRLGISRSWADTVANPLSRFHDPEYRKQVSARVRQWAKERAAKKQKLLKAQKVQLLTKQPQHKVRCCEHCQEQWPLTADFFPATKEPSTGKTYYLYSCRLCTAERRRENEQHAENPRTARLKQKLLADREEIRSGKNPPKEKKCIACWEHWPMLPEFWRTTRLKSGHIYFEPRCRQCQNAKRRDDDKARKLRSRLAI